MQNLITKSLNFNIVYDQTSIINDRKRITPEHFTIFFSQDKQVLYIVYEKIRSGILKKTDP
jgi:hypothetical protein